MRKFLLAIAVAFLFAMAQVAFAQAGSGGGTAGGSGGGTAGGTMSSGTDAPSSQSGSQGSLPEVPSEQNPSQSRHQSDSQASTTVGQTGSQSASSPSSGGKTVEGCVISQSGQFLLVPKKGHDLVRLSGGQDLSSYVGQHVKVHGIEQKTSASSSGGQLAPGTAEVTNPASGTGSTNTVAGNTVPDQSKSSTTGSTGSSGTSSSIGASSQPGASANAGVSTEGSSASAQAGTSSGMSSSSQNSNREIMVDHVDTIGQSCPANIQKNAPGGTISSTGESSMQH